MSCHYILVLMTDSTLPQHLDGFANTNIPACLIQYRYYLLLISCCQKLTVQHQLLLLSPASNLHTLAKMFLYLSFSHCALSTDPLLSLQTISSPSFNSLCSSTSSLHGQPPPQPLTLHIHAPILTPMNQQPLHHS